MTALLIRQGLLGPRVPITSNPFWIGHDPACHLVLDGESNTPRHARLRYVKGEYMLTAAEGETVWVNGKPEPMMILHDGDEVTFADPAEPDTRPMRFVNRMNDSFIPEGASLAQSWANHAGSRDPENGPGRYGPGAAIGKRPIDRLRCVDVGEWEEVVVKTLGPCASPEDGDRFLRLLTALTGTTHPGLASVLDGGLAWQDDVLVRWMATHYIDGLTARTIIQLHGFEVGAILRILRTVAAGLRQLHARGVVHRDVSPGNIVVEEEGDAVLIDYGHAVMWEEGVAPSRGVVGTPGYLAPEEVLEGGAKVTPAVDVYGVAAVGHALLTGAPVATGDDVLETLSRSTSRPRPLRELGIEVPEALDAALLAALSPDPEERPSMAAFERAMQFAEAQLPASEG
ncbi:MAG: serine/threonine-protein kinase [Planctomycetota bacterium]|nr:serine/threonine-protein kinase [Planctomycetota bacterium]